MKRFWFVVFLLAASIPAGIFYITFKSDVDESFRRWVNFSFCDRPAKYQIANIDPKFDITQSEFKQSIDSAGKIWSDAVDKQLFEYDEKGTLKISLVYDERQEVLRNIYDLNVDVEDKKKQIEMNNGEYEAKKQKLEAELEELNKQIDYWNSRGGAPEGVYNNLVEKQNQLQSSINELNHFAESINSKVTQINSEIHGLNEKVNYFNTVTQVHPEMGLYTSGVNQIEIFFYGSKDELIHVLAHEMGHSLGLGHVSDEHALMNPITSASTIATPADIKEITNLCQNKNRLDLIINDLQNYVYTFMADLMIKIHK